jgi:RNA polymerase-binding transcription factor DksA
MTTGLNMREIRARLVQREQELRELRRSLGEAAADPLTGVFASEPSSADHHPGDLGSDAFERMKDVSILASVERRLADVAVALERIDARTYGVCQACGEPIASERLLARPEVRFCIPDQERLERSA